MNTNKMDMVDKLNYLIDRDYKKSVLKFANEADVPYTTIKSILERDTTDIRLNTAKKICNHFKITLDELLDDNIPLPDFKIDAHAAASIDKLDISNLDERTKSIISKIVNDFNKENNN